MSFIHDDAPTFMANHEEEPFKNHLHLLCKYLWNVFLLEFLSLWNGTISFFVNLVHIDNGIVWVAISLNGSHHWSLRLMLSWVQKSNKRTLIKRDFSKERYEKMLGLKKAKKKFNISLMTNIFIVAFLARKLIKFWQFVRKIDWETKSKKLNFYFVQ